MNNNTKSYLSKNDQKMHWRAQVQKLRRIAVRAQNRQQHLENLLRDFYPNWIADQTTDLGLSRALEERDKAQRDVLKARDKMIGATEEMLAIAKANGDPRVAGF